MKTGKKAAKKQRDKGGTLTTAEALSLQIARLFPETFHVWGNRVSVKENAGCTEATRSLVSANLAEMYAEADPVRVTGSCRGRACRE